MIERRRTRCRGRPQRQAAPDAHVAVAPHPGLKVVRRQPPRIHPQGTADVGHLRLRKATCLTTRPPCIVFHEHNCAQRRCLVRRQKSLGRAAGSEAFLLNLSAGRKRSAGNAAFIHRRRLMRGHLRSRTALKTVTTCDKADKQMWYQPHCFRLSYRESQQRRVHDALGHSCPPLHRWRRQRTVDAHLRQRQHKQAGVSNKRTSAECCCAPCARDAYASYARVLRCWPARHNDPRIRTRCRHSTTCDEQQTVKAAVPNVSLQHQLA